MFPWLTAVASPAAVEFARHCFGRTRLPPAPFDGARAPSHPETRGLLRPVPGAQKAAEVCGGREVAAKPGNPGEEPKKACRGAPFSTAWQAMATRQDRHPQSWLGVPVDQPLIIELPLARPILTSIHR